ncbi:ECF-type sigma factor [Bremerella sp. JC770]|uniref:ECF-type sigma factor n=1 Tax=Bremerella sp. JC770 TaxID=3232137 RepID=UPI00345A6C35
MTDHGSVTNWLEKIREDDADENFQNLWNRYFERLVSLARAQLSRDVCRSEDEEDAVLSALNSFFMRFRDGRFPELSDRTSLWPLLVNITLCKARDLHRRQNAQKRSAKRTISAGTAADKDNWLEQIAQADPSPEMAVEAAEEAQRMLNTLGKQSLEDVARLKLEGYTNAEIAQKLGVMPRTIERRLVLIRQIWAEHVLVPEE